jgi:hypothetical protein
LELWAIGRYDLRLSEEEFWWEITPKRLDALMKRLGRDAWMHIRSAFLCALLGNVFNKDANLTIEDFMPGQERKPKQRQTPEQMLAIVKLYQRYFEMKEKHARR